MAEPSRSAFFYGTLMAPQVLHRVCHGSSDPTNPIFATHNFKTRPAILHEHRRHRVRHADYPGVIPHPNATVRGTYVTGLTDADIWRLDIFEGDQYERCKVKVRVLDKIGEDNGQGNVEGEEVEAETYIWTAGEEELEQKEWDFAEFQREKMQFWVGNEGAAEYAEVDEAVAAEDKRDGTGGRGANGHITSALLDEQKKAGILNGGDV
ncbi:disease resistance protein Aig2 [Acrodontium crateriforme]|uniref:Putative gamma-glutamylcyclotransferase n=1 Tax=Acrodontium crateriforme TaxID=150365 RepID=A0AAQ3LZ89_9PEZI|nr:disease resistance protein Aig2 [Acrodontium crateriforme]